MTANIARPNTKSLRATIPEGVVFHLDLKDGDKLEWKKMTIEGISTVVVRKSKKKL